MLRPWRYLRALAKLYTIALPSLSVYLVEEVIASKRSPPCKDKREHVRTLREKVTEKVHLPGTEPRNDTSDTKMEALPCKGSLQTAKHYSNGSF